MARILIVEDECIIALDLKDMVESMGHDVVSIIDSGEESVSKASETSPDLVFMDITLRGEMGGFEAAEKLRHLGIPVVYITAYSGDDMVERLGCNPGNGYILKPFDEGKVRRAIENIATGE